MKKVIILSILALSLRGQHNTDYLLYMYNGVLINPAFCGSEKALSAGIVHRRQWLSMEGAPAAECIMVHSPLRNKKLNAGVIAEQEKFGIFRHNRYSAMYAYRTMMGSGRLALGLSAGVETYLNNWNRIVTVGPNDPRFMQGATRSVAPHFAAGAVYERRRCFFAWSMPQLYSDRSFYTMMLFNVGTVHRLTDEIALKPALLVRHIPSSANRVTLTAIVSVRNAMDIGIGYISNTGGAMMLNVRCGPQIHIGYAYSQLTNKLRTYTGGSHELSLRYNLIYKVASVSSR
jgi:type IX secretion system PorP/SprF family membrane protein